MSTTLRADIEATVKAWRKRMQAFNDAPHADNDDVRAAQLAVAAAFATCADTLERLLSQHTGERTAGDVWAEASANPEFVAKAEQGLREVAEGKVVELEHTGEGQVTDKQVERACEVHWAKKHPKEEPWEMVAFDSPLWANDRRHLMRLAIEAALSPVSKNVSRPVPPGPLNSRAAEGDTSAASPVQGEKK